MAVIHDQALSSLPTIEKTAPSRLRAKESTGPDVLYSIMQCLENKIGGGEGVQGIYGSITKFGMQRILNCLSFNCGFNERSVLVDVGAGIGRPLLHALVSVGVLSAFGIEVDRIKVTKAEVFLKQAIKELHKKGVIASAGVQPPLIHCCPVEEVATLTPATHAYSFWEGIPLQGKVAFGRLFSTSRTLKAVAIVQRSMRSKDPAALMHNLGFGPVLLVGSFSVSMSGSGRKFQAYVFSKISPSSAQFLKETLQSLPKMTALPCPVSSAKQASDDSDQSRLLSSFVDGNTLDAGHFRRLSSGESSTFNIQSNIGKKASVAKDQKSITDVYSIRRKANVTRSDIAKVTAVARGMDNNIDNPNNPDHRAKVEAREHSCEHVNFALQTRAASALEKACSFSAKTQGTTIKSSKSSITISTSETHARGPDTWMNSATKSKPSQRTALSKKKDKTDVILLQAVDIYDEKQVKTQKGSTHTMKTRSSSFSDKTSQK